MSSKGGKVVCFKGRLRGESLHPRPRMEWSEEGGGAQRVAHCGLVIGVLSVSWSSELLLNFSAPRNTSTPLLMRTTSSPLTHDQHTLCC